MGAELTRADSGVDRRKDMINLSFSELCGSPLKPGDLGKLSVFIVSSVKDAELKCFGNMQGFCISVY